MSLASYVIICRGRIGVESEKDLLAKVREASDTAAQLVSHIELKHPDLAQADVQPISDAQHYLMDNMKTMSRAEVKQKITELFELLDELEDKYEI